MLNGFSENESCIGLCIQQYTSVTHSSHPLSHYLLTHSPTSYSPMVLVEAPLARAQWRLGLGASSLWERVLPDCTLKHTLMHRAVCVRYIVG